MLKSRRLRGAAIKALITDLDGVLRFFPAERNLEIESRHGLAAGTLLECAFKPDLLDAAIRGTVTDEQWRKSVAAELAARYPGVAAESTVREWSDFPGLLEPKNLAFLKKCAESCRLVLMTNATTRLQSDLERWGSRTSSIS